MRRPPVCTTCRRNPHTQECQAIKLREQDRYREDILEKWCAAMCSRWAQIIDDVGHLGVFVPTNLEIGEYAIVECGSRGRVLVKVQGNWVSLKEALQSRFFDKSTLPAIRHVVTGALDEYLDRIKEAKAILRRKIKFSRPPKISQHGDILDEFGADILQYGGFRKQ